IAGTVVNSVTGAPLGKARITLMDTANRANMLSVISGDDGHFEFYSLYRAKYSLQGAKRGFISAAYEQHEQFSTAIVTGASFNTENLVLRLTPLAFVSGKVIDESGEPVRKARVMLYAENHQGGMKRIERRGAEFSDDEGYYEFSALAPGNYFVSVSAKPWYAFHLSPSAPRVGSSSASATPSLDVGYPTTYNNGATDSQSATPFPLQAGDHAQVDVHLSPVPVVHLTFRVPEDQQNGPRMPQLRKRVFDTFEYVGYDGVQSTAPGVFELSGVPAGKYSVVLPDSQTGRPKQSSEITLDMDGQELDVSHAEAMASVKLSVKMPRQAPGSQQVTMGLQDSRMRVIAANAIDAAGEVTLEGIPPGKYALVAFSQDKRYSVVRTVFSGVETSDHVLTLTAGSSLSGTVFLAVGVVNVEGFVHRGGKPSSGVMVALIPKDPQSHLDMFRRDQSDSDGSFTLPAVIPGTYTLIAVEDAWGFQWMQPDVLNRYLQHGQNLTIGELMTNTVHLPEPVEVQPR
ncbi:MAG TPA: carboxypeptidase regulatory-like domain-containing protein, partial [Candidatus Sulfotelmatobacter sp.]